MPAAIANSRWTSNMGTAKTSPASWDASSDIEAFVDAVLV
jgi:hypothetical protein